MLATTATHLLKTSAAPDAAAAETMNEPRVDRVDVCEVSGCHVHFLQALSLAWQSELANGLQAVHLEI